MESGAENIWVDDHVGKSSVAQLSVVLCVQTLLNFSAEEFQLVLKMKKINVRLRPRVGSIRTFSKFRRRTVIVYLVTHNLPNINEHAA